MFIHYSLALVVDDSPMNEEEKIFLKQVINKGFIVINKEELLYKAKSPNQGETIEDFLEKNADVIIPYDKD